MSDDNNTPDIDRGDELDTTPEADEVVAPVVKADPVVEVDPVDPDVEPEEEDDKPEAKAKKPDARIPLSRHKEILEKERSARSDLERQLAQYQQGKQVADLNADITAVETKVIGLEKQYATLLTDGEVDKASAVMTEIRRLERDMSDYKNDMKIQAAESRATERARYNISLERVEVAYPQLNPDHDDFDADLLTDVADLKTTYERKGMTPTDALQKAVKRLAGAETKRQEAAVEVTPNVDAKAVAAERKKDAVGKALAAIDKTPPSTAKVGMDSDRAGGSMNAKDVMKMSYKDFSALPEESLARMRGDEL